MYALSDDDVANNPRFLIHHFIDISVYVIKIPVWDFLSLGSPAKSLSLNAFRNAMVGFVYVLRLYVSPCFLLCWRHIHLLCLRSSYIVQWVRAMPHPIFLPGMLDPVQYCLENILSLLPAVDIFTGCFLSVFDSPSLCSGAVVVPAVIASFLVFDCQSLLLSGL